MTGEAYSLVQSIRFIIPLTRDHNVSRAFSVSGQRGMISDHPPPFDLILSAWLEYSAFARLHPATVGGA